MALNLEFRAATKQCFSCSTVRDLEIDSSLYKVDVGFEVLIELSSSIHISILCYMEYQGPKKGAKNRLQNFFFFFEVAFLSAIRRCGTYSTLKQKGWS